MKTTALILATLMIFAAISFAADIDMQAVDSTLIGKIGYDAESETLAVQMCNSLDVYHYADVPQAVATKFLAAESKGRYFVENIKGQYTTTRK
jgi:S-adenosylmethionine synthetase